MMITINSRSLDGSIRKSWSADVIKTSDSLLIAKGVFEAEVTHPHLNVIRRGTISYEYFWLDRWYNVFRFHEPEGEFRNFYCNISMPPTATASTLDYVDLDLDIIVDSAGNIVLLDEDEFRENAERFGYTDEICANAGEAITELTDLIKGRKFPFDDAQLLQLKPDPFV